MAVDAGTVFYTVDADTQKAIDNTNKMNDSLQDLTIQSSKTEQAIKKYKSELTSAGNTIARTGVVLDEFGNVNEAATKKLQKLMFQAQSTNKQIGKLTKTSNAVKAALSGVGRNAGQAGIQVQQFIGQIQGGQSAMLALSQQSADLGFVLGAPLLGAIAGISASLVGMLMPSLSDSTTALEKVEEATENVRAALTLSADGVSGYSDQMKILAQVSEQLARIKLANLIAEQSSAMEIAAKGVKEAYDEVFDVSFSRYKTIVKDLFGETSYEAYQAASALKSAAGEISKEVNSEAIDDLTEALQKAEDAGINTTKQGRKMVASITTMIAKYKLGELTINDLREQLNKSSLDFDSASSSVEKYTDIAERLEIRTESLKSKQLELEKAITLKKAREAEATLKTIESISASYDKIIASAKEAEAEKALTKSIRERAAAEREAEKTKNQHGEEDQLAADEMIRRKVEYDYNQKLLGQVDPMVGEQQRHETELANLKALKEAELLEEQRYLDLKAQAITEHEQNMQALREENFKKQSEANAYLMDSLDTLGDAGASALSDIISGSASASEAMRSLANTIMDQALSALVSIGIQYLKNQIIEKAAAASSVATAAATGTALATSYSTAATLASIATMGAAAATGGTAVAAAVASNKVLAGMAHDGISEVPTEGTWLLNKGERVYTNDSAKQLDQMYSKVMMPDYPSKSAISSTSQPQQPAINLSIEVVNNAPGVDIETQQTDEGVRIIATQVANDVFDKKIDGGVSKVLGTKGTKANRTITSKYHTRNKY